MANIKVPRGSNASSTKPMPKANRSKKSGSQKLEEFRKATQTRMPSVPVPI